MRSTNSWQCEKCGRVFNQDYQPGCCDNCGGLIFLKIASKSETGGSRIFSGGNSFADIFAMGIGTIIGTVLGTIIGYTYRGIKSLFRYIMKTVKSSDKQE